MKVLDRYILKTFLVSLGIVMTAMLGIALLLDLSFNVKQILHAAPGHQAGFWTQLGDILNYYFYKAFAYFQMLAAPSLLVAAAASLVRLNRGRELVGMKAAGISLYRIMWPMIALGLIVNGFYILNQEIIIPSFAVQLSRTLDDLTVENKFTVDFVRDQNNNIIYAPIYDPQQQTMLSAVRRVETPDLPAARQPPGAEPATSAVPGAGKSGPPQRKTAPAPAPAGPPDASSADKQAPASEMEVVDPVRIWLRNPKSEARGIIEAESARWDPAYREWRLTNGFRRPAEREPGMYTVVPQGPQGEPVDVYATNVDPKAIQRHRISDFHRYMSYGELTALAEDPMRGNRRQIQVAMHQHVTGPIMNLLLLLLGLPFVAGRDDRNYFTSVGTAIALTIGVFALTFASTAFGNTGHISPLLAAWLPVFVVLPSSILSMEAMRT
jgi:lipopolysaccharide export LptBFGC system permease protein LptF